MRIFFLYTNFHFFLVNVINTCSLDFKFQNKSGLIRMRSEDILAKLLFLVLISLSRRLLTYKQFIHDSHILEGF